MKNTFKATLGHLDLREELLKVKKHISEKDIQLVIKEINEVELNSEEKEFYEMIYFYFHGEINDGIDRVFFILKNQRDLVMERTVEIEPYQRDPLFTEKSMKDISSFIFSEKKVYELRALFLDEVRKSDLFDDYEEGLDGKIFEHFTALQGNKEEHKNVSYRDSVVKTSYYKKIILSYLVSSDKAGNEKTKGFLEELEIDSVEEFESMIKRMEATKIRVKIPLMYYMGGIENTTPSFQFYFGKEEKELQEKDKRISVGTSESSGEIKFHSQKFLFIDENRRAIIEEQIDKMLKQKIRH